MISLLHIFREDGIIPNAFCFLADYGRRGLDGQSATIATDGTPGSDSRVRLSYSIAKPGYVMVAGEGTQSGYNWELSNTHALHLDCRGGEGGNGGRGEDGQQGGNGAPGRNASKYHDSTVCISPSLAYNVANSRLSQVETGLGVESTNCKAAELIFC
jgi:hypothetical protein